MAENRLISADTFRSMAKRGAKAADFDNTSVFKAGAFGMKALGDGERVIEFIASNSHLDREGDSINVDGWELEHYRKNPVVLFGHAHGELPVGKALTTWLEGADATSRSLRARDQFVERDIYPFADTVYQLLKGGYLNAVSVGFQPMEWKFAEDREGINFLKHSLLEHSVVPVPAHPEALVVARAKGIDTRLMKAWAEKTLDLMQRPACDDTATIRQDIERFRAMSDPTGRKFVNVLADIKMPTEDSGATMLNLESIVDESLAIERTDEPVIVDVPVVVPVELHGTVATIKAEHQPDPNDPIRWNRRLSKAFDIAAERFVPADVEEGLAARYLDCQVKELAVSAESIGSARMGAFLLAVQNNLGAWHVDDVRNLNYEGKECPPLSEIIQLTSTRRQSFLIDGIRFMRSGENGMCLRVEPRWFGLSVRVYARQGEQKQAADAWMDKVFTEASELKLLQGEAFTLSGEFLPRGSASFDDVFLTEKNIKAIKRTAALINTQGAAMENRGLLVVGPPGTGKTLVGRILMSVCPKATYVWISARDFHAMGAFQGMAYAFDTAREFAPTILFVEDVDNWLSDRTCDLLKTEMDGLAQSKGVVTILTTNYPELLPKALMDRPGRFHDVLQFDLPDDACRTAMLARWLPDLSVEDITKAVAATAGYSGAHMRELARFVDILKEQDSLELSAALDSAIVKLKEQRELINQVQTQGSRYARATPAPTQKGALLSMKDYAAGLLVLAPGEPVLNQSEQREVGSYSLARKLGTSAAVDGLCDTIVALHAKGALTTAHVEALQAQIAAVKMGRVLSAANETRIEQASSLLQEVLDQLKTPDEPPAEPAKAGAMVVIDVNADVLLLDEEIAERAVAARLASEVDIPDLDPAQIKAAIVAAVREEVMLVTGRVD